MQHRLARISRMNILKIEYSSPNATSAIDSSDVAWCQNSPQTVPRANVV